MPIVDGQGNACRLKRNGKKPPAELTVVSFHGAISRRDGAGATLRIRDRSADSSIRHWPMSIGMIEGAACTASIKWPGTWPSGSLIGLIMNITSMAPTTIQMDLSSGRKRCFVGDPGMKIRRWHDQQDEARAHRTIVPI